MKREADPELLLAGACAVAPGQLVFGRDRRSGRCFPVCPDCGCAFPDFPRPPMTIEDYRKIEDVCPDGVEVASREHVRESGLIDSVSGSVSAREFAWTLDVFSAPS